MKVISTNECDDWTRANIGSGFTIDHFGDDYAHGADYVVPPDSGKKTALGRMLIGELDVKLPGLFWIIGTGIWPSSENMALLDGYRKSFGESRPISVAPGHVFSREDLEQLECLLDLTLYFYWDSLLFDGPAGGVLRTSHDEYISIRGTDRDWLSRMERIFTDLGMKQMVRSR